MSYGLSRLILLPFIIGLGTIFYTSKNYLGWSIGIRLTGDVSLWRNPQYLVFNATHVGFWFGCYLGVICWWLGNVYSFVMRCRLM